MTQNRRQFLSRASLAFSGILFAKNTIAQSHISKDLKNFGIILNTVSKPMENDYKATLTKLAEIGYTHLEGGTYGDNVVDYAKFAKSLGLQTFATGSAMSPLMENPTKVIKTAEQLGAKYIVCYYPYMSSSENLGREDGLKAAENLNKLGRQFKSAGFRLAWHNHAWEFKQVGDETIFDVIMNHIDPALVTNELDIYWVVKGNADPVALFDKYPGRFELIHAKDMINSTEKEMTCVGQGTIDFKNIFKHAKKAGIKRIIVENEQWKGGMECAAMSFENLATIL